MFLSSISIFIFKSNDHNWPFKIELIIIVFFYLSKLLDYCILIEARILIALKLFAGLFLQVLRCLY
jgi:hypothetical protein